MHNNKYAMALSISNLKYGSKIKKMKWPLRENQK